MKTKSSVITAKIGIFHDICHFIVEKTSNNTKRTFSVILKQTSFLFLRQIILNASVQGF